jgi:tetratricopeptide (TPR) repeat protein
MRCGVDFGIQHARMDDTGSRAFEYRRGVRSARSSHSSALIRALLAVSTIAIASSTFGCPGRGPVAPTYEHRGGAPIADEELPLASAQFAFSPPKGSVRKDLARPLADRMLRRATGLFSGGREAQGLATVRIASMLLRTEQIAASDLSDEAVLAIELAVNGPAARGDEGASLGLYTFWSSARPNDARPKVHLENLESWSVPQQDADFLVNAAREATRRSDALAYAPTIEGRAAADASLYRWMDGVVLFKDREGRRNLDRYGDEAYAAVTGYRQAGLRVVAGHLRDGDVQGARDAIDDPKAEGFVPEDMREALSGSTKLGWFHEVIGTCVKYTKIEGLEEPLGDAIIGVGLLGTGEFPTDPTLAEVAARGFLNAGEGDAAPAILARALLGTKDEPRRPGTKDLARALVVTAAAIRDFGDREDWDAARRTYTNATPILVAAESVGGVATQVASVRTLMGYLESEAGRPAVARQIFDASIGAEPNAAAYAGLAQLEVREGKLADARSRLDKALAVEGIQGDAGLHADVLTLSGDVARRSGDAARARDLYERALRVLVPLRASLKGAAAADVGRRVAYVLAHFEGMADKEDEYASAAESTANEPRLSSWVVRQRFLRALRTIDPKRAHAAYERGVDLGLRGLDAVEIATMHLAIDKRAGVTQDAASQKLLRALAAKDDAAGKIAKLVLDGGDLGALAGSLTDPTAARVAKFALALQKWAASGPDGARAELLAVVRDEHVGTLESELAEEALEPTLGAVPGTITSKQVPNL